MTLETTAEFSAKAASFALTHLGNDPGEQTATRFAFSWLAAMNYLEMEAEEIDLLTIDPHEIFDAFLTSQYRLDKEDWSEDALWEKLRLEQTIYSDPRYLRWIGIQNPDVPIHQLITEELLARLVQITVFGGVKAPDITECVALESYDEVADESQLICSGVLIHPCVVLSAGHCARSDYAVFGPTTYGTAESIEITDRFAHQTLDVALYRLSDEAPEAPARLATSTMVANADEILIAGFGAIDLGTGRSGERRKALMGIVAETCSDIAIRTRYGCDAGQMILGDHSSAPAAGPCPDDSGGPGFVIHDSQRCVASVIVGPAKGGRRICGDASIHVRVDPLLGWINDQLTAWSLTSIEPCS